MSTTKLYCFIDETGQDTQENLYRKIRGMGDEQSAFLRLADAMAGFLRDSIEGESYAVGLMPRFIQKGIIVEI